MRRLTLSMVAVAAIVGCAPDEPRFHVATRLLATLDGASAALGDGCGIDDEHRPSLGCTPWTPWGASTVRQPGRHFTHVLKVAPEARGKPLFLRIDGKGPTPGARWRRLPEPRVIVPRAPNVRLFVPSLPADMGEGTALRIWKRPAPATTFATRAVAVAPRSVLTVGIGFDAGSPPWGVEAVEFVLPADAGDGPQELLRERLPTAGPEAQAWNDRTIALDALAGRSARFRFAAVPVFAPGTRREDAVVVPLWGAPEILVADPDDRRPNVILVSLDTLRADLGSLGAPVPITPNIDRLAAEGVVFENANTTFPSTTGGHLSMLTGRYPVRLGVGGPSKRLDPGTALLAQAMGDGGWQTAAVTENVMLSMSVGFARGVSHYRENLEAEPLTNSRKAAATMDRALAWLERHRQNRFFLFVHTYAVHYPYAPPPEYAVTTWRDGDVERPYAEAPPPKQLRLAYAGDVRYADAQVGRLIDMVRANGLAERTIVVVTADHGEAFHEHFNIWGHSTTMYDEIMRIPLVFWAPGRVPAGRRIRTPVSLVDVPPTILDLVGLPPLPLADGTSQLPRIDGAPDELERVVYAEVPPIKHFHKRQFAARTTTKKWIVTADDPPTIEGFNMVADPGEQRPVDDPAFLAEGRGIIDTYRSWEPKVPVATDIPVSDDLRKRLEDLGYAE